MVKPSMFSQPAAYELLQWDEIIGVRVVRLPHFCIPNDITKNMIDKLL